MTVENSGKDLEDQLLYKLGSLEALVVNGMRRIDEQLTVLVDNFIRHQESSNKDVEALKKRVTDLETWRTWSKARIATAISGVSLVWLIFGRDLQAFFNGPLGQ
jgi:hypothetical protein